MEICVGLGGWRMVIDVIYNSFRKVLIIWKMRKLRSTGGNGNKLYTFPERNKTEIFQIGLERDPIMKQNSYENQCQF